MMVKKKAIKVQTPPINMPNRPPKPLKVVFLWTKYIMMGFRGAAGHVFVVAEHVDGPAGNQSERVFQK